MTLFEVYQNEENYMGNFVIKSPQKCMIIYKPDSKIMRKQSSIKNLSIELNEQSHKNNLLNKNELTSDQNDTNGIEMKSVGGYQSDDTSVREWAGEHRRNRNISKLEVKVVNKPDTGYAANIEEIKSQLTNQKNKQKGESSYDILDLTYTLMSSKVPITITTFLFVIFVLIRYYTFACLVYMAVHSNSQNITWVLVIIVDRVIYAFLVVKISLSTPETKTEVVLKSHWNSKESSISQLFQVVDKKKLATSILRGLIPAELSFIYIRAQPRRKFQLYSAINYINASIEAVIYYPFFVLYCYFLTSDNTFALNKRYQGATIAMAVLAELIMLIVTISLLVIGIGRRKGKVCFCF